VSSLLLAFVIAAAPVPPAKPPYPITPSELIGKRTLEWGGTLYTCTFSADGVYTSTGTGGNWKGSWLLSESKLTICERQLSTPNSSVDAHFGYVWTARLSRIGPGTL